MPFGLCNAPATFERMRNALLHDFKWSVCVCYLDGMVIISWAFYDHLLCLKQVLDCFRYAGIQHNSSKCTFRARQIKELGYLVSGDGVRPDPENTQAVADFPAPLTLKQVRYFIGVCTYFRKFISGSPNLAEPLNEMLAVMLPSTGARNRKWLLGHSSRRFPRTLYSVTLCREAVRWFAGMLVSTLVSFWRKQLVALVMSSPTQVVHFLKANEMILLKKGNAWPLCGPFKSLDRIRREVNFTILTNCRALCWLAILKDPSEWLGRWPLKLQEYNVSFSYKSGKQQLYANCVSWCSLAVDILLTIDEHSLGANAVLDTVDM